MAESGLITISQESVRKEHETIVAKAKELTAQQDRFMKLIDYLRAAGRDDWIPPDAELAVAAQATLSRNAPAASGTWNSELIRELEAFPNGAALIDLLEVMKSGPIRDRVKQNRNGIYNAASKLEQARQIVKHNGRVFLPHHYRAYLDRVERGEIEDVKLGRTGGKTAVDTLTEFITSHPQGLEAGEIVSAMKAEGMSPGTVYNNLSKVVQRNRVRRDGKVYLPLNSEAPSGKPDGASKITDGEMTVSPSNTGAGDE